MNSPPAPRGRLRLAKAIFDGEYDDTPIHEILGVSADFIEYDKATPLPAHSDVELYQPNELSVKDKLLALVDKQEKELALKSQTTLIAVEEAKLNQHNELPLIDNPILEINPNKNTVCLNNKDLPVSEPIFSPRLSGGVRLLRADEYANQGLQDGAPTALLGRFVFEGEVTILAAPSNVGKSIFAVALAHALSDTVKERSFLGFKMKKTHTVLYYDFELSSRQFAHRYYGLLNSPNFIRAEYDFTADFGASFSVETIAEHVALHEATVVIIDNLSALVADHVDINQFSAGKRLIWDLKRLVNRLASPLSPPLTVVLLAHTRKLGAQKQLDDELISGTRNLVNLADAVVMMGRLKGGFRYLKQCKARSAALYEQCLLCEIEDRAGVLTLAPKGWHDEATLLGETDALPDEMTALPAPFPPDDLPDGADKRYRLASYAQHLREQGLSLRQIARLYQEKGWAKISHSSVRRLLIEAYGEEVMRS